MTTTPAPPDTSREAIEALAYRLGVIANEEVVGKPLVDVYPDARDGRAALLALLDRAEAAERDRDNWKAHAISRGKRLRRTRDEFINIRDELCDEGDRVYFGSTNHADAFKDAVEWLDDFTWGKVMGEPEDWDLLGALEKAQAALAAERDALRAALEEAKRLREALEKAKFTYNEWWKDDHYEAIVPLRAVSKIIDAALSSTPPASAPDITETFDIDAQLTAARTEGRREGLREAIRVARIHAQYPVTGDYNRGYDKARKDAVRAIEALADQEPAP